MGGLAVLFFGLTLGIVGILVTARWARRLWQRRNELPLWRKLVMLLAILLALWSALGVVIGLIKAFGAVGGEAVDPSQKARLLAEGISEALNFTVVSLLVFVPTAIAIAFLMRKPRETPRE
jgi:phosphotransferase system  glucose/maltose/N-acetylglucosamine-specific IIC component